MALAVITVTSHDNNTEDLIWPDLVSLVNASCSH